MAARGVFAVGLDPTRSQVEVGRDRAGGPAYAQSGCEALPIADGSVDAVVVCLVFEHVDDVASAFAEIARVCGPVAALRSFSTTRCCRRRKAG